MNLALLSEITIDPEFKSIVPPLTEGEFEQLEENIIAEGCRDAIVLWNNIIIDGHNRYKICQKHNLPYSTIDKNFPNREAVIEWMILNQLGRRNISAYDRARLALKLKPIIAEKAKENQSLAGGDKVSVNRPLCQKSDKAAIDTKKELANTAGVSHDTIVKVEKIEANAIPEVKEKVRSGDLSIHAASQLSKAPEEEQKKIIGKIASGEAKSVIDAKRIIKKEENKEVAAPLGKYRVLYADPPWQYGNNLVSGYGAAVNHYPTMTIKELCELPVSQITEDNAVLFLWTTSPLLEESFAVIKAWGFKYKTSFVWDKVKHNMGHYNSVRHELLLICTKGSCLPDNKKLFDSVVEIERTNKHSEKPDEFREIIEALYTHGKKIELFSRKKVDGWEAWGNDPNVSS